MKIIEGLNQETKDILNYASDKDMSKYNYITRPLTKADMPYMKSSIPFGVFTKGKLGNLNPLLPYGLFREYEDVAFMSINEQAYKGIGFVMFGNFYKDTEKPDSIEVFLAKKDKDNGIVLWKNLKSMPGFESTYRYGNSDYAQKQKIIPGAHKDTRGSIAVENNAFDLMTATRLFLSKAEKPGFEKSLIEAMYKNKFEFMDPVSIYKKVDSWATKYNDLISGKLENSLFAMSQIKDVDILKPKTFMGDQFLVARKFNVDLFDEIQSSFKRGSSDNRISFNRELSKYKKELEEKFNSVGASEKNKYKYGLGKLKDFFISHNLYEFKSNISSAKGFENAVLNAMLDRKKSTDEKPVYKDSISGERLKKIYYKFFDKDYLGEVHEIMNTLRDFRDNEKAINDATKDIYGRTKYTKEFDQYAFKKDDILKIIKKVDDRNEKVRDYLGNEMNELIKSKVESTFTSKYLHYLKNSNKPEDFNSLMAIIERDTMREFYDKYNEKMELYNIMLKERRKTDVSEMDLIADRVRFVYDKNNRITDAIISPKNVTGFSEIKDKKLQYAYYKAGHKYGLRDFKALSIDERLGLARKYLEDNKSLIEKHSTITKLSKYDTVDDFKRNVNSIEKSNARYETLAGDIVSRTNDKIIGKATKEGTLEIEGAIKFGDDFYHLNFRLNKSDGFNYNDYAKEMMSDRVADFKMTDLKEQLKFNKATNLYNKNYKLQNLIYNTRSQIEAKYKKDNIPREKYRPEIEELNQYLSFLKGGNPRRDRNDKFGLKNGELVLLERYKDDSSIQHFTGDSSEKYKKIYNAIVKKMNKNYKREVGYGISDVYLEKDEKMQSMEKLASYLLSPQLLDKMNRSTYLAIMNRDEIINTSGASKQTGVAHGDSYLGSLGYAQPGLAWNKVTQRTFQAQDVLGEQSIETDNGLKTVSEINANIIKRLGLSDKSFSGVGIRKGKYTTEELYKQAVNEINNLKGINNAPYMRGETYKTFAIGDINLDGEGLNKYSMSFQEGMTAAKSMILTTNSIRSKKFTINLEELNLGLLDGKVGELTDEDLKVLTSKFHNKFSNDEEFLKENLSRILDTELFKTIEGREKYDKFMRYLDNEAIQNSLDGSYSGMKTFYNNLARELNVKPRAFDTKDTVTNRMKITNEIYKLLEESREKLGSVALPDTRQGKKKITNKLYVKTFNELKPEYGFSIRDYSYNPQTRNIELMLENIGVNTQGSKGQSLGAKFTISEIQDFLKVKNGNKEIFVDALFNNKAEKRQQTGMMIHGTLQTAFSNIYETSGVKGVRELIGTMKDLLSDMKVFVNITGDDYEIDETYLTQDYRGKKLTAETLKEYMTDPTLNMGKLFNERGAEILDDVIKKYGSSYFNGEKVVDGDAAHFGIINAIQKAYSQAYKKLDEYEIPLTMVDATVSGYKNNKEMAFGKGSILLLRAASERVNSTASKKKESALKISREMLDMLRVSGFKELGSYIDKKNTEKLSKYLGNVYTTMNNSELLNTLYSYNQKLDMKKVSSAMSNSLDTGVLFDLDTLNDDDYLLDDSDLYMKHSKLMDKSSLGKVIKARSLDTLKNGELKDDIDVVIYDSGMNAFTKNIKTSIANTLTYLKENNNNGINDYSINFLERVSDLDFDDKNNMDFIKGTAKYVKNNLENINARTKTSSFDIAMTKKFVELLQHNSSSRYSLSQLKDIMNTGNILTTIRLNYGVDEDDGSIVASNSFRKIQNIARKNFEFKNKSDTATDFYNLYSQNDKKAIDYIIKNLDDYYNDKSDYSASKLFIETVSNLNTKDDRIIKLKNSIEDTNQLQHILRAKKEGADYFLQKHHSELGMTKSELENLIKKTEEDISNTKDELSVKNIETLNLLRDSSTRDNLKQSLDRLIFDKDKMKSNGSNVTFNRFFSEKQGEDFASGFALLDEYIKVPVEADKLFHKKGSITSAQKYKITSSLVANPLEGSNLMNKIEIKLFEGVKNKNDFINKLGIDLFKNDKNESDFDIKLGSLTEFLGTDIVNENLFKDENGKNVLEEIKADSGTSFKEGLEKARKIFSKNFSEISEVTITDRRYTESFRNKDFEWKDLYTGKNFKEQGFIRELAFFSRHPQQTINHMGGVLQITLDSRKVAKSDNEFAKLALSYLPVEKNNAGVITLGKKTMLYRRGD